jgi:hypothetical protein
LVVVDRRFQIQEITPQQHLPDHLQYFLALLQPAVVVVAVLALPQLGQDLMVGLAAALVGAGEETED